MVDPEGDADIHVDPRSRAGVWATSTDVTRTMDEFAIDFVRVDPFDPTKGVLVARVAMSSRRARELLDALEREWRRYAAEALPKEVRDERSEPEEA